MAGLILTATRGLRRDIRQDMARLESRLDERINGLESRLDGVSHAHSRGKKHQSPYVAGHYRGIGWLCCLLPNYVPRAGDKAEPDGKVNNDRRRDRPGSPRRAGGSSGNRPLRRRPDFLKHRPAAIGPGANRVPRRPTVIRSSPTTVRCSERGSKVRAPSEKSASVRILTGLGRQPRSRRWPPMLPRPDVTGPLAGYDSRRTQIQMILRGHFKARAPRLSVPRGA